MRETRKVTLRVITAVVAAATVTGVVASERIDPETLFETSDKCMACHNGLVAANGDDASIGAKWRATVMAHTAVDPYWHAGVRREILEHPKAKEAIEDKCSTCHMPMARFVQRMNGKKGEVLANNQGGILRTDTNLATLAADGVSCAVCHQVQPKNFGKTESFGGGFLVDTVRPIESRQVFGPFRIADNTAHVMRSAVGFLPQYSEHMKESAFCATCHTLYTHALDENGKEMAELAEQVPYLEWLHSDYVDSQSCQDCHMATVPAAAQISSVLGKFREGALEHRFRGGNFLLMRLLSRNRNQLGVQALPEELEASRRSIEKNLTSNAAVVSIDRGAATLADGHLAFPVVVENLAGHKLPTAYPSRRVWLHVKVEDGRGEVVFESGALNDDGSIKENDNDANPLAYEPHYTEITSPDQVQIYESIMGDLRGAVTTGLLSAATYLKDNRVLPAGFDKATADESVAVAGDAIRDENFEAGRDLVIFRIPVSAVAGPYSVTAKLWYQPVGYRWAMNLDGVAGEEPPRFLKMFRALPGRETAVQLTEVEAIIEPSAPSEQSPPPAAIVNPAIGG